MWKELKIPTVYTMEASFCGPDIGSHKGFHFSGKHLEQSGQALCLGLLIYCDIDVPRTLKDINKRKNKKGK